MAFRPGTLFGDSGMGDLVKRSLNQQSIFDQPDPFRRQAKEAAGATASPVTINVGGQMQGTGASGLTPIPDLPTDPTPFDPAPPGLGGPIGQIPTAPGFEGPYVPPEVLEATIGDMPQVIQQMLRPLLERFRAGEIGYEPISELSAALGVPNPSLTGQATRELAPAFAGNPFISRLGRGRMFLGNAPLFNQFRPGFFGQTSPTLSSSMEGLLQSLGIQPGELQFYLSSVRPASFR